MKHENPKTLAEHLDNAEDGEQFGNILGLFITSLAQMEDDE